MKRKEILQGFLDFRAALHKQGFMGTEAFQWLDGSFLENIEMTEGRPPGDIDVLTLYWGANVPVALTTFASLPEFYDRRQSKMKFHVDHFPLNLGAGPQATVENIRYWIQLFAHRRDGVWKGMLRLPLDDDKAAQAVLTPASTP